MITAALFLVCLVLAGAVAALAVAVRRLGSRVQELSSAPLVEEVAQRPSQDQGGQTGDHGLVTGVGAPCSTSHQVVEEVAQQPSRNHGEHHDYVITRMGDPEPAEPAPSMEAKLFADVVLRESVVKAASWAHGFRHGLSPANRNRIWFEMRREVKRARKERKAEEREAIREWRARQRAAVRMQAQEESAA